MEDEQVNIEDELLDNVEQSIEKLPEEKNKSVGNKKQLPDGIILHELGIVNPPKGKRDVQPTTVLTPSCKKVTLPLDSNSESEVSDKDADKEGDTNTVCFIKKWEVVLVRQVYVHFVAI